ncbi:DUF4360 domain-containing protein [Tetraselmis virus 1]|uniref:DUF4360 domain-containing protein n=1 Tax=Tetraselmis virus 1 TaxID=2060617 RepID=A0A2P0VP27_9VIRU|nr:DUF4360 domain-containing protein [Tetraselmis virus 1]AUF82668.1 DUF4360 domain-containing protein [Tetraselmis virus 1]
MTFPTMRSVWGILVLIGSSSAFSVDLSMVSFGGSGCPQGTVSVITSPDNTTVSVLFDSYTVSTDSDTLFDRKSCNLALPIKVPNGYSIALKEIDYRGYASIPDRRGSSGRFRAEYFFGGFRGPVRTKRFRRDYDRDFLISDTLVGSAVVFSPCGASVNFRINTSLDVRKRLAKHPDPFVVIDTTDIRVKGRNLPFFSYKFIKRACS